MPTGTARWPTVRRVPDPLADVQTMQTSASEQPLLAPQRAVAVDIPPERGESQVFFLSLQDSSVAVWKPLGGVSQDLAAFYSHTPEDVMVNEVAAWQLAKRLGEPFTDLVPVAVWRELPGVRDLLIDANPHGYPQAGEIYNADYDRGVLIQYVPGRPVLEPFTAEYAAQANTAALFDSLIGQQDRHLTNFRWDASASQLHLIDNGFAFPPADARSNESVFLQWRQVNHTPSVNENLSAPERDSLLTLQRSGQLDPIAGLLREDRGACLLDRCQTMLATGRLLPAGDFGRARATPSQQSVSPQAREAVDLARMASPRPAREGLTQPPTPAQRKTPSRPDDPQRRQQP